MALGEARFVGEGEGRGRAAMSGRRPGAKQRMSQARFAESGCAAISALGVP
jgi:hypothetical protein